MKRHLIQQLSAWKVNPNRKPLILRGVRQTGKTYLLEHFGETEFSRFHIINFEKQPAMAALFEQDLEPKRIIEALQFQLDTEIDVKNDLLIFDEIQACPRALTSLKYFCEDMPELALCAAGSLLGLRLSDGSYPVGKVDMLHLYPMTFSEFLQGIGDDKSVVALQKIDRQKELPNIIHEHLWKRLKQYFITGGLPEVVSIFAENQDNLYVATKVVRAKQDELIKGYYADIAKYSGKVNSMHIDRVWQDIPKQLSQSVDGSANKFKFIGVIPNVNRYSQLVNVIDWLSAAELVIKVPIITSAEQPLSAAVKDNQFKLLMFDIGILGSLIDLNPKTILDYDYGSYKGYFAENFVAQQLLASLQCRTYCWEENRSEVEFILQHEGAVVPIEVKSGHKTQAKSLHKFIEKYKPARSFILSAKNLHNHIGEQTDSKLFRLPLYLVGSLFG